MNHEWNRVVLWSPVQYFNTRMCIQNKLLTKCCTLARSWILILKLKILKNSSVTHWSFLLNIVQKLFILFSSKSMILVLIAINYFVICNLKPMDYQIKYFSLVDRKEAWIHIFWTKSSNSGHSDVLRYNHLSLWWVEFEFDLRLFWVNYLPQWWVELVVY